ncbi:MAG: FYDLN acid domain-containing protein [Alphaproteobacteria bacterium]|nr:FYDLN acid domain-containing protein [Alphaproteobacteria bacterium]
MKLEWGKKVSCPACALPFYSMQKASLVCPNCGNKFELSELTNRKRAKIAMDETPEYDKNPVFSGFDEIPEEIEQNMNEEDEDIAATEVIKDMKFVDGDN